MDNGGGTDPLNNPMKYWLVVTAVEQDIRDVLAKSQSCVFRF
jgi:hypothetical protein